MHSRTRNARIKFRDRDRRALRASEGHSFARELMEGAINSDAINKRGVR
jgi:hypothetical protein